MNLHPWLVAVGAGRWQLRGIQAARAAGLRVLAVDGQADAPGLALADLAQVADIRDPEAVIAAIGAAGITPGGVIAFCNEAGMLTTAVVRERFDLPGARTSVVLALTRKDIQRERWTAAGLPGPRWFVAATAEEAENARRTIGGTTIVKPVDSAGSRGVTVLAPDQLSDTAFAHAVAQSPSRRVIIEAFIVGVEHTVETFTHAGRTHVLAITAKKKVPGTSNTVASELATATLAEPKIAELGRICSDALQALGYHEGPGHTELLQTPDGRFFLVESAGRGGGFMVADGIVPRVSGFDLATACALQAVGRHPPEPSSGPRRAAVLRFLPSRAGRVTAIRGFEAPDPSRDVWSEPMVVVGQTLGRAASDGDRMAYILSAADTPDAAQRLADEQERRIDIAIE